MSNFLKKNLWLIVLGFILYLCYGLELCMLVIPLYIDSHRRDKSLEALQDRIDVLEKERAAD